MEGRKIYKLALLAGAATMLQGCVAAVVPLAASGLMGVSVADGDDEPTPAVAGPAIDPSVIVETRPTNTALADSGSAPAPETSSTARIAMDTEEAVVEAPAPAATVTNSVAAEASVETAPSASEEFASAFAATGAQEATSPVAVEAADPVTDASEEAALAGPIDQAEAAQVSAQPSAFDNAQVRRIAVDSEVALADTSADTRSVSASEAAAALATGTAAGTVAAATAAPSASQRRAPAPSAIATAPSSDESPVIPISASASSAADPTAITALISYANQSKFEFRPGQSRTSAILIDRVNLEPDRASCVGIQPTVLIDLDPNEGTFSPLDAGNPPAGLAAGLDRLRAAGVAIAWISGGASSSSELYRDALARTGLDESGADQLLLMRGPDDRKQIRREQLAQQTCLIAIAGDDRSDFDELYDYLLNPGDAAVLEPLIGEGWFLIPTPLLSERPN
ncbi:hypothetical protein CD351_00965 [Erythrobacter sp. KY5]|uniref:hypothetical protein n=1 Tax=Erythrobacter sp. KY5 TaxID=2011159 RepID=UPI000DBEF933|nr:hypothetical protein [Erythrobacter sp. KY5]AWW72991.1 hypothetical protein CD351_00965 [Erythrobacter sp. KY5]